MFSRETMLEYHLQYNHFPPQPVQLVPYCVEAIEAVARCEFEHTITFPNGDTEPAWQLVENLHLDCFVEEILDSEMEET